MTRRVLFVRVGWMRWYKGPHRSDKKPIGGGKNNQNAMGHEVFNFSKIRGRFFGYFHPYAGPRRGGKPNVLSVNLARIEAGFKQDALDNVLVIFVAKNPKLGKQRIVGWYNDATVYCHAQKSPQKERNGFLYFLEAEAKHATLIPEPRVYSSFR